MTKSIHLPWWRRGRMRSHGLGKLTVVMVAGMLALSSCSNGDNTDAAAGDQRGGIVGEDPDGDPVDGGTLTFAPYAMVSSLDPLETQSNGATGGTEMAAVYDMLVRFDNATNTYEPQLAKSFESNNDDDVWTLKLRPDVTFSDGTPLDANAVLWSINRFNDNKGAGSELWVDSVQSMEATAPDTVEFTLKQPWTSFPAMLATAHGLTVAPSSETGGDFTPIGAGPFVFDRLAPNEELVLSARDDYWGGTPHLAAVRFVPLTGDSAKLDSLKAGQINAGFIRNDEPVAQALDAGYAGYADTTSLGAIVMINNREGRPGADVGVRKAIQQAVDVDAFDQRVNQGLGMPDRRIFADWSRWSGDVAALPYDTGQAAQHLQDAQADGYDGVIRILAMAEPTSQNQALTLQAMLQAVGFTAEIDYANNPTDLIMRRFIDYDYDIAYGADNLYEAAPEIRLAEAIKSDSPNNALGYNNPQMDRLLDELHRASSDEEKVQIYDRIQQAVNDTVPFVALGAHKSLITWTDKVGGVVPTIDGVVLFGEAWVS